MQQLSLKFQLLNSSTVTNTAAGILVVLSTDTDQTTISITSS